MDIFSLKNCFNFLFYYIVDMEFININGKRFHCIQQGNGKNLVLLHGLPGFCYDFRFNANFLSKYFRITIIDFKGFGHSEKRDYPVEEFKLENQAKEILEILNNLDINDYVLLGHDMGSIVAQLIAQEIGCKLILINPACKVMRGRWRELIHEYWYIFFYQTPIAEKIILNNLKDYIAYILDHWSANHFSDEEKEEYIKAYSEQYSIQSLVNWYRAFIKYFKWEQIKRIKSSTLIIWGTSDPLLSISWIGKLGEEFDNYNVVKVDNAGHWPHVEKSDEVNRIILDFLIRN